MTPAASRQIRDLLRAGHEVAARNILAHQFFECSEIYDLAHHAAVSNENEGCLTWSPLARLPADLSWFEFVHEVDGRSVRRYYGCKNIAGGIEVFTGGFYPGQQPISIGILRVSFEDNTVAVQIFEDERLDDKEYRRLEDLLAAESFIIEQILCMLNQPGLIDRDQNDGDNRIRRAARTKRWKEASVTWSKLRISPGMHKRPVGRSDNSAFEPIMPLHYVRKHFKPSIKKWVDGYWRGDASVGTHLKTYEVKRPCIYVEDAA